MRSSSPKSSPLASFAGLAVLLLASGCSNLLTPLGADHYDCNRKENPASPYCHSFKAVEQGTNGVVPASRFDEQLRIADHDKLTNIAPVPGAGKGDSSAGDRPSSPPASAKAGAAGAGHAPKPNLDASAVIVQIVGAGEEDVAIRKSLEGRPVRRAPLVQRVWVKAFTDGNDMLTQATFVYKEIMPARWSGVPSGGTAMTGVGGGAPGLAGAGAGAFPHRPAQPLAAKSSAQGAGAAATPTSSFTQPGQSVGERGNALVPVPAREESGTTSMPQ